MATLNSTDLAVIRQGIVGSNTATTTKPVLNAALQAVEDWFEDNRVSLGGAIEAAAPGAFTANQKRRLVKFWLNSKFGRE